jgi:hypothetical protein
MFFQIGGMTNYMSMYYFKRGRVLENWYIRRMGGWAKLHNEEFNDFCSLPNIIGGTL